MIKEWLLTILVSDLNRIKIPQTKSLGSRTLFCRNFNLYAVKKKLMLKRNKGKDRRPVLGTRCLSSKYANIAFAAMTTARAMLGKLTALSQTT